MAAESQRAAMPRTVWALGAVSLFMDVSSEIVHALLPLFLTTVLGASVSMVGLIDGVADSTASIAKVFSGYLSDRFGRRKPFIVLGYGMAAVSKPLFALATNPWLVFGARFADRIGKGLRGAPRDALITDVTPAAIRGRAFGLRQALDTVGAFVGPMIALALMALLAGDFRMVFWVAVIPAAISVSVAAFGVDEKRAKTEAPPPVRVRDLKALPSAFWLVAAIGAAFTLARFSEAFLILRAHDEGLPAALAPLVLVVMNIVYSLGAYPTGVLADTRPGRDLLVLGLVALIVADLVLAFAPGLAGAFSGIALWGAHMALTQGLLAKLVADAAPASLRGSAFGVFNLLTGAALFLASVIAGVLWDKFGAAVTFSAGAGFALFAMLLLRSRLLAQRE